MPRQLFVIHIKATYLAVRVLGKCVIICGVQVNNLTHPMDLLTPRYRKLFSYFTSRLTIMKINFYFLPEMSG